MRHRLPATLLLSLLAFASFCKSGLAADEFSGEQFSDLSKRCRATSALPASTRANAIATFAKNEHRDFHGNKVDHTGRMLFFGHAESESDQGDGIGVTPKDIPWRRVLYYWEALNDNVRASQSVEDSLEAWYYPNALGGGQSVLSRKKMQLKQLLSAIGNLDLSGFGDSAPNIRSALQQSAIRSSISDVAWSAAFVSATMRNAGLTPISQFTFSPAHVSYIGQAVRQSVSDVKAGDKNAFYRACDPENTKPRVGDLFCYHRHVEGTENPYKPRAGLSLFRSLFNDLAAGQRPIDRSHCDIVVNVDDSSKKVTVVGGNVQNSVTEKILNINRSFALSATQGTNDCKSYNPDKQDSDEPNCNLNNQKWFVLLQSRM